MRRALFAFAVASPLLLLVGRARGDDKQRCIVASEQGQELRDDGNYRRARAAFATCASESCPPLLRRECAHWQADLEQTWPSVVFSAKDDKGNDLVAVRVQVDGEPAASRLDGNPVRVDPGEHAMHYEAEGYPAITEHVVVHAGERNRVLRVQFAASASPAEQASSPTSAPSPAEAEPAHAQGGSHTSAIVFGAIALAAFGTEAYFGLTGLSDRSALQSQPCAQSSTCSQTSVDSIRTKFTVADIALGVGIVSAGLATYLFFTSKGGSADPPATARIDIAPMWGGAAATFAGRF